MGKLFFITLILFFQCCLISVVNADDNEDQLSFEILVTVHADDISIDVSADGAYHSLYGVDAILPSQTVITPFDQRIIMTNAGTRPLNLSLQAATHIDYAVNWTQRIDGLNNSLNANQYRLSGIFTKPERSINLTDFNDNDVLDSSVQLASQTSLAFDSENDEYKGIAIPVGEDRSLFFRFDAPDIVDFPGELLIDINITAIGL